MAFEGEIPGGRVKGEGGGGSVYFEISDER